MYENVVRYDKMLEEPYPKAARRYEEKLPSERTEKQKEQYNAVLQAYHDDQYSEFVEVYSLANYLEDPTTANIVVDAIRRFSHYSTKNPCAQVINFAFRSTTDNNGLRLLFVDSYVYNDVALPNGDLPKEFLRMVVDSFLAAKQETDITVSHDHCKFFNKVNGSQGWAYHSYYQQVDVEDDSEDADDSDDSDE